MSSSHQPLGRTFVRIWGTQTLSIIGSTLSGIGVAVYVYLETGDARWLGVLAAVQSAPFLVMAPVLGRLDRFSRRSMLLVGDCLAAVGPVFALVLVVSGRLAVWHLVVAGLLSGLGNAVQSPAASAVVPALVPGASPELLARANGLFQLGPAAGIVIGPAVATPLVAWSGIETVLLVNVATFVIAVTATLLTRFDDAPDSHPVNDDRSCGPHWVGCGPRGERWSCSWARWGPSTSSSRSSTSHCSPWRPMSAAPPSPVWRSRSAA